MELNCSFFLFSKMLDFALAIKYNVVMLRNLLIEKTLLLGGEYEEKLF